MQKTIYLYLIIFSTFAFGQNIDFEDTLLKNYILTKNCVDTNNDGVFNATADFNNDGEIQFTEALAIERLSFRDNGSTIYINSITDLNHFTNLKQLVLVSIPGITNFETNSFSDLEYLWIGACHNLKHIDISNAPNITYLRIEDIADIEYLNLQNGSFPTEYFSLFYSEGILEACVDNITQEYDEVAWHMLSGVLPSVNCALSTNDLSLKNLKIHPNPTNNTISFNTNLNIESIEIYNLIGEKIAILKTPNNPVDVSNLKNGVYIFKFNSSDKYFVKKIIRN